ncbi:metallophosphoesterase [Suttonella ornithocola]|uniref:Uncharacterized metallophosphoesterase Cj0846 n=1 Tax=Suttonella ornithocola TaxID=279832 RepID=A0A380MNV4_9GAMM|nr:metallophosphoesterase [Suttonella ornithocola]SUO93411.1 Uncharacterized metallophosphoesterase Cj0846 [Suttonella ornithocola]
MPRWIFILLVVLFYQILLWGVTYSLRWVLGLNSFKWQTLTLFILANGLLVIAMMRIYHGSIAVFASILALLWIWTIVALVIAILWLILGHKAEVTLRILLPVGFLGLVLWGWFNAYSPVVRYFNIHIDKPVSPFKVMVASDLHLGKQVGIKALDKLAALAEREKPDIILLPGDIINDTAAPYLAKNMFTHLGKLKATHGVYATLGNHEFYGNAKENADAIRLSGIKLLRNESVEVSKKFIVIGRDDDHAEHRPPLEKLIPKNTQLPILVMDHRPTEIEEASHLPIDIQVSGHTHKGQIFPANFITKLVYLLDYGYKNINDRHFFVTSGYGFWGIPLRLGSRAEIFIINVN